MANILRYAFTVVFPSAIRADERYYGYQHRSREGRQHVCAAVAVRNVAGSVHDDCVINETFISMIVDEPRTCI